MGERSLADEFETASAEFHLNLSTGATVAVHFVPSEMMPTIVRALRCRPDSPAFRRLIIAAREIAFGGLFDSTDPDKHAAIKELDQASEAFAALVPWPDEPA